MVAYDLLSSRSGALQERFFDLAIRGRLRTWHKLLDEGCGRASKLPRRKERRGEYPLAGTGVCEGTAK